MSDSMYDKLGDLLNEAIESDTIPQAKKTVNTTENEIKSDAEINNQEKFTGCDSSESVRDNSTLFHFKSDFFKKRKAAVGQVIKSNNLPPEFNFPVEIKNALKILQITDFKNITKRNIQKKYHQLIKSIHPDKNEKSLTDNISLLNDAYKILMDYFSE